MIPQHVEGRIAFLQAEISIADAQIPQWHAAQADSTSVSVPARGEREIQFLSARLDAMRTMHVAGSALYAALSDDQKKIEDD